MDAKKLIENLIDAIEQIHVGDTSTLTDAKETAGLARMVVKTMDAAPAAPVGNWFVTDDDSGELTGPFPTNADAQRFGSKLSGGYELYEAQSPGAAQPTASGSATPVHAPSCQDCGGQLDANGDCVDPTCPSGPTPVQSQTFDEVMNDLHDAANKSRPGSVISNRPPGSLYQR